MSSSMSQHLSDELNLEAGLRSAINQLKTGDFQGRWDAAKAIPRFGTTAIDPLLTILEEEDTDWELLWFVARILGNLNDPSVITVLINLLKTAENSEVASMAATALTNYGVAAIAPLTSLLHDESTRLLAVQALVQIRHADVVSPLLKIVNDPSPEIRAATIEALGHFYDPAISMALLAALDDLNSGVRKAAVISLGIQAQQLNQSTIQSANQSVNQLELTEHLKQRLWDVNLDVCTQSAIALGRMGTNTAADALFEILRSDHALALKIEAVRALTWSDTVYALNHLQNFLHLPSPLHSLADSLALQQEIFTVLGRVESADAKSKAVEILLTLLSSNYPPIQEPKLKQTIALSLAQLGQLQALDPLISLLADTNASVRFHVIAALKQLHSETAYQRLQELALDENINLELQSGVAIALQEWGS